MCKEPHYLKSSSRTKSKGYIIDGDPYKPDEVNLNSYVANCYITFNSTIYDLSPLSKYGPFYMTNTVGSKIEFDVCKNVVANCNHDIKGLVVSRDAKTCKQFSNTWSYDKKWSWSDANTFNLQFPEGQICNTETKEKFKVNMLFKCNKDAKDLSIKNDGKFDENSCTNTISVESVFGIYNI